MFTSAGWVRTYTTASATASGRSICARGVKPSRLSGSITSQSGVSTWLGETSVARTPEPRVSPPRPQHLRAWGDPPPVVRVDHVPERSAHLAGRNERPPTPRAAGLEPQHLV